jgi:SagB-type dehydrogenase family enzyme
MNTVTKLVLGMMGKLRPVPARGGAPASIALPSPVIAGGMPLMDALRQRRSERDFLPDALPDAELSNILWAAFGINRPDSHGRTAPSALNAQEMTVYVALPQGAYRYVPDPHQLELVASDDVRRVTGHQDYVDTAPLDLVLVADHPRLNLVPVAQRMGYAAASAGAIAQNVYLYCASAGLATVVRGWFDREALSRALGLSHDQEIVLTQTVGYPKRAS